MKGELKDKRGLTLDYCVKAENSYAKRPYNKLYTHLVFKPSIIISCDSPAVSLHNVFVYVCVCKRAIMGKCGHRDTVPRNPAKTVLSIRLVCSVTLGYLRIDLLLLKVIAS